MTTMPLRGPSRSVWKKSRQERALRIGARVGDEQLAQERRLLRCPATIKGEQPFVDQIEVHAFGVPAGIKVTGLLLGSDEAAVDVGACRSPGPKAWPRYKRMG